MFRLLVIFCILQLFASNIHPGKLTLPNTITPQDLQGDWQRVETAWLLYSETNPMLAPDADEYTTYHRTNVRVKDDSIYVFEYPCKYLGACYFSIQNGDSLYYGKNPLAAGKLERNPYGGFELKSFHPVWKTRPVNQRWTRDTLDTKVIKKLRKDSIDYGYLTGQYNLVTHFQPPDGEGYDETYPINVPVHMTSPSEKQARTAATDNKVTLIINGQPRDFKVWKLCWTENNYYEQEENKPGWILEPGNWWKGDSFLLHYRFSQKKISVNALKKVKKAGR